MTRCQERLRPGNQEGPLEEEAEEEEEESSDQESGGGRAFQAKALLWVRA